MLLGSHSRQAGSFFGPKRISSGVGFKKDPGFNCELKNLCAAMEEIR